MVLAMISLWVERSELGAKFHLEQDAQFRLEQNDWNWIHSSDCRRDIGTFGTAIEISSAALSIACGAL